MKFRTMNIMRNKNSEWEVAYLIENDNGEFIFLDRKLNPILNEEGKKEVYDSFTRDLRGFNFEFQDINFK